MTLLAKLQALLAALTSVVTETATAKASLTDFATFLNTNI